MEEWAEAHRLLHREGLARRPSPGASASAATPSTGSSPGASASAATPSSGSSPRRETPRYRRAPAGSQLDRLAERMAELLAADPTARATVIREPLQPTDTEAGARS